MISSSYTDHSGEFMDGILFFITIMTWIFNIILVLSGVAIGVIGAAATPPLYRRYRRWSLHRDWRRDRPQQVVESLEPRWEDFDPDLPTVDKRCICHRRIINPGEHVLLWPSTGPGGILHIAVYCHTVKEKL